MEFKWNFQEPGQQPGRAGETPAPPCACCLAIFLLPPVAVTTVLLVGHDEVPVERQVVLEVLELTSNRVIVLPQSWS